MKTLFRSIALLLLLVAAGCSGRKDAELLAAPKVGDLYASELSHFAEFDGGNRAYGLMKVVAVTDGSISVVTDSSAWPAPSGANNDLRGDLADVKWDTQNTLRLARSELRDLYEEDRIFGVRRPDAGESQ